MSMSGREMLASSIIGGAIIAETLKSLSECQFDTSIFFTCICERTSDSMERLSITAGEKTKEMGSKR